MRSSPEFAAPKNKAGPSRRFAPAVIGGGCSGLQYKMDLVEGPAPRDIMGSVIQCSDRGRSQERAIVSGSVLDFSDDLQKGGFKVTNPNAVAHCSCGKSFAA